MADKSNFNGYDAKDSPENCHLLKPVSLANVQIYKIDGDLNGDTVSTEKALSRKLDDSASSDSTVPVAGSTKRMRIIRMWIVVAAAFLCSFVVDGVASSYAAYSSVFSKKYPSEKHYIEWIGSLLYGMYLLSGPLACGLAETFGYSRVIFCGSVISAIGFFCSCFVPDISLLFLTFSIIGGVGFGLLYSPSIMCVCAHFKEQNALAAGIAVCGSSVGGMVVPIIAPLVIKRFGWEYSMFFLAGLALLGCLAALAMSTPVNLNQAPVEPRLMWLSFLPVPIRQALHDMFDFRVYLSTTFVAYNLASFIGSVAFLTPIFFLPKFAESLKATEGEFMVPVTAVSGAGIFGRVFFGWLADHSRLEPLTIHNVCIFLCGVSLVCVPFCETFSVLLVVSVIYGVFVAPYISLMSPILTSRLGLEQLPAAFGQTQLVAGLASIVGPPLHEHLGEVFTSGRTPFFFAGGAWILASLIACVIFWLPKQVQTVSSPVVKVRPETAEQSSVLLA